jgi:hypothetical protein
VPADVSVEEQSRQALVGMLQQAKAQGDAVDESQLEILRGDSVTFEQYQAAVLRALSCATDAGLTVHNPQTMEQGEPLVVRRNGQEVLSYVIGTTDERPITVWDSCLRRYAEFVEWYWNATTPTAIAWAHRREQALYVPLRECLEKYGVDFPADSSFYELSVHSTEHWQSHPDEDCLVDIGYEEWDD